MPDGPTSTRGATGFVAQLTGRSSELAVLRRNLEDVLQKNAARIVTISGSPGMGKSRLVAEFVKNIGAVYENGPRLLTAQARGPRAFGLWSELLRSRFSLENQDDPKAYLRAQISGVLEDRKVGDVCHFLGSFLGLDFQPSPMTRAVEDAPHEAWHVRRAIVRSFFAADARQRALCIVCDDLEESDPDSLDLLASVMEALDSRALFLCVARPQLFTRYDGWSKIAASRHTQLTLEPLDSEGARSVVRSLLTPCVGGPPDRLVEAAVEMAGGNPALLGRMVHVFHDVGVLEARSNNDAENEWVVNLDALDRAHLPMTVDDAIAARVAALNPEERRLLTHAATVGSVFWRGAIQTIGRRDLPAPELWLLDQEQTDLQDLRAKLDDLVDRDYLLRLPDAAIEGEEEFAFKHNLERQRLLELAKPTSLRRYHQMAGDWILENADWQSQEDACAMLAEHLEKAHNHAAAGLAYLDAADLARKAYATKRAHQYYRIGLQLLGDASARRRIDALHNQGDVLTLLGRTEEALASFRGMLDLAFRLRLFAKGGAAHNRIGRLYRDTGALTPAAKHLRAAMALFEKAEDQRGVSSCQDDIGKLLWIRGEYEEALDAMKGALEMRKKLGDRRSIALSFDNIGMVWLDHGRTVQAREALEAALTLRREINDPLGLIQSLNNLGKLAQDGGDHEAALSHYEEAYRIGKELGENNRTAAVLTNIGETHYRLNQTDKAIEVLSEAESLCDELGDDLHLAEAKRGLAKAYLLQGELKRSRECIRHAVDLFGKIRSKPHLAIALRTLAEVTGAGAWGANHEGKAIEYFMRSIALCKEIGNELEVAKSYQAFVSYVRSSGHYQENSEINQKANTLQEMANEIFERHKQRVNRLSDS